MKANLLNLPNRTQRYMNADNETTRKVNKPVSQECVLHEIAHTIPRTFNKHAYLLIFI